MQNTRRTWLIGIAGAGLLSACGFELRQTPHFAFQTFFANLPEVAPIWIKLRRALEASDQVEVITDVRQLERAQVIYEQLAEIREKLIVGRTSTGAIRELQLRLRYSFQLRTQEGKELIPSTEIWLTRDINYSETGALSKELEEGLLYRDMENDLVQQIIRRLAALRQL